MSLKKCIGLVTMAIVGGAFAVGCSSSDTAGGTTGDSGTTVADTGVRRDTGTTTEDAGGTADAGGTCTPLPVTGYTPSKYNPPKQQNVCTTAEINKIATDCSANFTSAACVADLSGTGVSVAVAAGGRVVLVAGIAGAGWEFTVGVAGAAGAVPPPQAESRSVRANSRLASACRRVFTMGPFSLSMSGLVLTIAYRTQYALNNQSISVQRGFRWRNASAVAPLPV